MARERYDTTTDLADITQTVERPARIEAVWAGGLRAAMYGAAAALFAWPIIWLSGHRSTSHGGEQRLRREVTMTEMMMELKIDFEVVCWVASVLFIFCIFATAYMLIEMRKD